MSRSTTPSALPAPAAQPPLPPSAGPRSGSLAPSVNTMPAIEAGAASQTRTAPLPLKRRRTAEEEWADPAWADPTLVRAPGHPQTPGQPGDASDPLEQTAAIDPSASPADAAASESEGLLAQAGPGAPTNAAAAPMAQASGGPQAGAPSSAQAPAGAPQPAASGTSIGTQLLAPLTETAPWVSADWFDGVPTGAAGTGALLAGAALLGGGGGGGSSGSSTTSTPADTRAPVLQSAEISNAGGTQLVLTYDENLNSVLPAASAFQVLVDGSSTSVSTVARGSDLKTVVLTLGSPVTSPRTVKVSLGDGSQVRDGSGNVAATFRDQAVTVTDKTAPTLISQTAITNPNTNATNSVIVLRYSEDLLTSGRPEIGQFQVTVGGVVQNVTAVNVLGDSIRLSLGSRIPDSNPIVRLSFTQPANTALAVQDAAGNRALAIDAAGGLGFSPTLDGAAPTLLSAVDVGRHPRQIRLNFTEVLDAGAVPAASSLAVDLLSVDGTRSVGISAVKLSGAVLELTLAEAVTDTTAGLRVRYSPPATQALQDWAGNVVTTFDRSVTRVDGVPPTLVSSRFITSTQLELTFDEVLGTLGPDRSLWSLSANGGTVLKPTGSSISGTKLTLTFDTAIQTGQTATLSYAAPTNDPTALNLALQDTTGNDAGNFSRTFDTAAPRWQTAATSTNGLQITLNYNEALLSTNAAGTSVAPATSAFTVLRNGQNVTVSSVTVTGTEVRLGLTSAILPSDLVGLIYTAPSASIGDTNAAIQDTAGNDAASLGGGAAGQTVTNNALPAVSQLLLDSHAAALDRVVMTLNVAAADPLPATSAFTVKVGGNVQNISRISRSGQDLVLELSAPITSAGALLVSYTQPSSTANPLKDANGKLMASFSDQSFGQVITGTAGADTLFGQAGRVDYFLGSAGTDSLQGNGAADHFVWPDFGTGGPGGLTQTIKDFGFKNGAGPLQGTLEADLLDLSQLLDGYTSSSTLANFVRAVKGTGDKLNIEIDHNGNVDNSGTFTKTATLVFDNVTVNGSNQLVVNSQFISGSSGNVTLANVITHLMTEGQLAVL